VFGARNALPEAIVDLVLKVPASKRP